MRLIRIEEAAAAAATLRRDLEAARGQAAGALANAEAADKCVFFQRLQYYAMKWRLVCLLRARC